MTAMLCFQQLWYNAKLKRRLY